LFRSGGRADGAAQDDRGPVKRKIAATTSSTPSTRRCHPSTHHPGRRDAVDLFDAVTSSTLDAAERSPFNRGH
ncbi:hypothetical protein F2P81_020465, partial [Scophthalmus maximus]